MYHIPVRDRPRERLQLLGVKSLATHELISILLGKGTKQYPIDILSREILSHFPSLTALSNASIQELQKIQGIGPVKGCTIQAALELARRMMLETKESPSQVRVTTAKEAYEILSDNVVPYQEERFIVLSLSTRKDVIAQDTISIGTLSASLVHPRETMAIAIKRRASSIIISHNHPSGEATPSQDDFIITKRLVTAGKIIGIPIEDHIILGKNCYYSFREHGHLV